MIKRQYIQNINKITNIKQKEKYDKTKYLISHFKTKKIFFSEFLFAKNMGWIDKCDENKIDINYFKLLPFLLNNPNEIYKNTNNNKLVFVTNIDLKHKVFHIINSRGVLIDIIIKQDNFSKQLSKDFVLKEKPFDKNIILSHQSSSYQNTFWNQTDLLKSIYQKNIFESNYSDISYAKINIFLKIVGKRDNYHMLVSRFVRIKNLFDIIEFQVSNCDSFTLEGNFSCEIKKNTIYKAYKLLSNMFQNVKDYFKHHKIVVKKDIPEFAGLGGGSSNCATFILMVNDVCKLNLSKDILAEIGAKIGSDVPFFIYEYDSANVSGIGENVKQFNEEIPKFQIITPNIKCDTSVIFQRLRDGKFYCKIQKNEIDKLLKTKSIDILNTLSITEANDLYKPALYCNNKLQKYAKDNWFFSGSGSSFFKLVN